MSRVCAILITGTHKSDGSGFYSDALKYEQLKISGQKRIMSHVIASVFQLRKDINKKAC